MYFIHQYVSAAIAAETYWCEVIITSVKLLLKEYKCINLVSCTAVTPYQLKLL
jgi:hypothetical protein